jgi:hypothetical protein
LDFILRARLLQAGVCYGFLARPNRFSVKRGKRQRFYHTPTTRATG